MAISGIEPLEVPTIYKAYVRPSFRGWTRKIWPEKMVPTHFRILKLPCSVAIEQSLQEAQGVILLPVAVSDSPQRPVFFTTEMATGVRNERR